MSELGKKGEIGAIGLRIDAIISHFRINARILADRIAMSTGSVSELRHGKMALSASTARTISLAFGVSEEWLTTGQGEMFMGGSPPVLHPARAAPVAPRSPAAEAGDIRISELITKTIRVLESATVYRTALASNIHAFAQAVEAESRIVTMDAELAAQRAEMAAIMDRLARIEDKQATYTAGRAAA